METVTRKQALLNGSIKYFTGKECKRGHISERLTKSCNCCECLKMAHEERQKDPIKKERANKRTKNWCKDNSDYRNERCKQYLASNPEAHRKHKARVKQWDEENKDRRPKYQQNYQNKEENRHKITERNNHRRAVKIKAEPKWIDRDALKEIYKEARKRTKEDGIQYHVDHIVPLRHELVCGLHCEDNLQVLTEKENLEKSNNFNII